MGRLQNKIALITGAASGIGLATAQLFSSEGASLMLADIDSSGLDRAAHQLKENRAMVHTSAGDLASSAISRRVADETIDHFGRIDILFNNAGIDLRAKIEDTSDEDLDRILSVNFKAVFLLTKYVVPHMIRASASIAAGAPTHAAAGAIVNTSSAAGLYPIPGRPAYCATKGAIVALTKALALDLAPHHIRVNCICPGAVDTPLLHQSIDAETDQGAARASLVARYPLGRLAEPNEIARAALFLASSESSYITGATLAVDGGRTMH